MSDEPQQKKPEGTNIQFIADFVGWPIPTWVDDKLYKHYHTGDHLVGILNAMSNKIRKNEATIAGDSPTVKFKYWRKPTPKSRKAKPLSLRATLYRHPEYDTIWCLMELNNES